MNKMKKITKKEFKQLHADNKLLLIQSVSFPVEKTIELLHEMQLAIKTYLLHTKKVTNVHLEDQGKILKIKCFTELINGISFYFVASTHYNQFDPSVSWDGVSYDTTIYVLNNNK